jgi:NitT/TauT family transport system ATP-binding protein
MKQESVLTKGESHKYLVSIKNLIKKFNGANPVIALSDVNLDIQQGEFLSIVGPSGCGKTTLLRLIAGLEEKSGGELHFSEGSNHIGFIFQQPNLLPWRTALANVKIILELQKVSSEESTRRAKDALKLVGLSDFEKFFPKDLSGGMRHRVSIARALVHDPDILVMDEPFSSLDELTKNELHLALREVWLRTKKTIIYVTHDLTEAVFLSERIAVMSAQPGTITSDFTVPLPLDRALSIKDTESFVRIQSKLRAALGTKRESNNPNHENKFAQSNESKRLFDSSRMRRWLLHLVIFTSIILFWKGFVELFNVPHFVLPPPERVVASYLSYWQIGNMWYHTWVTLSEILSGFAAGSTFGILLGYVLGKSAKLERFLSPYIVAAQVAPKIVFAPLFIVWFGFGLTPKALLAMLIVFFPILINTILGLKSIDKNKKELLKAARASRAQILRKLELPAILPEVFAGLKTGITLAVIAAVVVEFFGSSGGLGFQIMVASGELNTSLELALIIQLIVLGTLLYLVIRFIERRIMPWRDGDNLQR